MKTVQVVAGALIVAALAVPAGGVLAKTRKPTGPAPQGCIYGPRGGLHCNSVRFERETVAERRMEDARLRRECKGRPRAGACSGYN